MNQVEFYEYIKPIADRCSKEYEPALNRIGFKWEQEKFEQDQGGHSAQAKSKPFKYINGRYSPYAGIGVYAYLRNALEKGHNLIRLGPAGIKIDAIPLASDHFSKTDEIMISYFLETARYDQVLEKHLEFSQENGIFVVRIKLE
ncbi:MAG: hypothetical protein KDJ65_08065 [Anaerolineae bacterium]|nr:hypothetical protein [Anaerolineae bacterium]